MSAHGKGRGWGYVRGNLKNKRTPCGVYAYTGAETTKEERRQ